eukprot:3499107-Amphidinium_carterae.1
MDRRDHISSVSFGNHFMQFFSQSEFPCARLTADLDVSIVSVVHSTTAVSYTHLRAHETEADL